MPQLCFQIYSLFSAKYQLICWMIQFFFTKNFSLVLDKGNCQIVSISYSNNLYFGFRFLSAKSSSECNAIVNAYMECIRYFIMNSDKLLRSDDFNSVKDIINFEV